MENLDTASYNFIKEESAVVIVNEQAFWIGHNAFLQAMKLRDGQEFTGFSHPVIVEEELAYKIAAQSNGRKALQVGKWDSWIGKPGRILEAVKHTTDTSVSSNLLEHRYGTQRGDSDSPLYRVTTVDEIASLESELNELFRGGGRQPTEYGPRFDHFADYLREQKLGCKWPFLAYLSFLMDPQTYFPVLPGVFQSLFVFYGIDKPLAGKVEWSRYETLLGVAEEIADRLGLLYGGTPSAIEVQSYMYVVARLVQQGTIDADRKTSGDIDAAEALARRIQRAKERERIGFEGEKYVLERERELLTEAGRRDLAIRVRHVADASDARGYDILSFDTRGIEKHLEVKTTQRFRSSDPGFLLTENEYQVALTDPAWTVVRVWSIDREPEHEDIGNPVKDVDNSPWTVDPASWRVWR